MLDMSRLNSGRVRIDEVPFDMRLFAAELERMFTSQAADKGLKYSVELEDCENVFVVGDRMRLSQVVINFISNALKFTEAAERSCRDSRDVSLGRRRELHAARARHGQGHGPALH
ncbi:MAG: sensor histidine kinase [Collinsella sp.]